MVMAGKIHIGTSGWSYKHWRGTFYPDDVKVKDHFNYYKRFFTTVELNNPFYHLPPKQTFINWKNDVADDFVYVVKASRYITHMKKLKDPAESLTNFLENVAGLEEKLGVILFQLPPGWGLNLERFREFLEKLPSHHRYVFEFRNGTWYDPAVYSLMRQYNCGFCIYELAGHVSPFEVTADFVYVRLHGPGNKYQGSYSEEALQWWAAKCLDWAGEGKDVFVYFDNDEAGYAAFNAIRLNELTGKSK
jgi:uncharacterized protein YecE (DUF72 family)